MKPKIKHLVDQMLEFNHRTTGLPVPKHMPHVALVSESWLTRSVDKRHLPDFDIMASYHPVKKRVYLKNSWDETNLEHRSLLVHELVHHMQNEADVWGSDIEADAYKAQFAYLRENGVQPEDIGWPSGSS